jgi:tetratricopeptide (TPR) repeat protein
MGEVYKATDTNLNRAVAIKVLPASMAGDAGRLARFQREAEVLASLNHPHIAQVYGLEKSDGLIALVMELVEGPTLADRIAQQPMPPAEALHIAKQIAEAVDAAHGQGIIHRDLKPANIKVRPDGAVKVLDFGLAKTLDRGIEATQAPTRTAMHTGDGVILGTVSYMSPEQARGQAVDKRADIWAFGCVLYEMLAGRPPFEGLTVLDVAVRISAETHPPLNAVVPASLRAVVDRCLSKPLEGRYQDAGELRRSLDGVEPTARASHPPGRRRLVTGLATAMLVLITGWGMWTGLTGNPERTLSTGGPPSPHQEANDLFELAMNFQRVQNDIPRAQETLARALAIDARFAEARRYHAFNRTILLINGETNDTSVLYMVEQELQRVAADAPDLPSLPSALTAVYLAQGRKELVPIEALDRAVERYPTNVDARLWRMILHMFAGENAEALAAARVMLEREPLAGAPRLLYGELLRTTGDAAGAIREERRVIEQAPGNMPAVYYLSLAHMDSGDLPLARRLLEEKRQMFAHNYQWRLAWALLLALEGRREDAVEAMDAETVKHASAIYLVTVELAEFYALLDDVPRAIAALDQAVRNGDERIEWFLKSPRLSGIRGEPRFQQIVTAIQARRARRG